MSHGFGSLDSFGMVMGRKSRFLGLFQTCDRSSNSQATGDTRIAEPLPNYCMAADQENESTLRIFRHTLLWRRIAAAPIQQAFLIASPVQYRISYRYRTDGIIGEVASFAEHLEIIIKRIVELIFEPAISPIIAPNIIFLLNCHGRGSWICFLSFVSVNPLSRSF